MDRNTILRKIRACLRLAGSSNTNEAAAALRQAKALMHKYGISEDEADPEGICEVVGKTRQRGGEIHYRTYLLAATCARLFGCYLYAHQVRGAATTVRFVGVQPNPELAEYAFAVLNRQLERDIAQHIKRVRKAANRRVRAAAFGESWVFGLRMLLGDQLTDLPPDEEQRYQAFAMRDHNIQTKDARVSRGSSKDRMAGFIAGRSATLNKGIKGSGQRMLEGY
ncbi:hypothetical protein CO615_10780 [Lysobacteraceae bacterium NML75-0749]|nr:hypothetical protein CO615_10780 [Xanthomonadaceae bacterium NML75-0749]